MSQKSKRGSVALEEKGRTESPVKDMKKKAAANAEKERAAEARPPAGAGSDTGRAEAAAKPGKSDKPVDNDKAKVLASVPEGSKTVEAAKQNGTEKEKRPNGVEPAVNGNGTVEVANGTNGVAEHGGADETELPAEDDEVFPELAYEDGSDEEVGAAARSTTRRDEVKSTRTPETPRPASNKADDKTEDAASDEKVLKLREEFSASPMKLRSAEPAGEEKKEETSKPEEDGKEAKNSEGTVKKDTNFSKSRIKVSPYRRSTRLQDSMIANYTGNNTTMETDMSVSELESTAADPELESSHVSRRSIRGRRSYKLLAEFVPTPRPKNITLSAGLRPTVHVVGRKRKPQDEEETVSAVEEAVAPRAEAGGVKRMRLLERVVTPLAALVRRVPSRTALPQRHTQPSQIVGINTDLPLHGAVETEPEALPASEETEVLKTVPAEPPLIEVAVEAHETPRQKCTIM